MSKSSAALNTIVKIERGLAGNTIVKIERGLL